MNISNLTPQEYHHADGAVIYGFPTDAIDLVRVVVTFEAGSFYQQQPLMADAALKLFGTATLQRSQQELAEYLDYRGIVIEKSRDTYTSDISLYTHRKYLADALRLLQEMFSQPLFAQNDFNNYCFLQRQKIAEQLSKTSAQAYRLFHQALYGNDHRLARFAVLDDVDRLDLDAVRQFFDNHFQLSQAHVVLAGNYTPDDLALCQQIFSSRPFDINCLPHCTEPPRPATSRIIHHQMTSAQTTIRMGRTIPLRWDDPRLSQFMVLNTLLGGYFGSRLMSNIREDKGYTYGVQSCVLVGRDDVKFFIVMDCGNDVAHQAVAEVYHELERLRNEPIPDDELTLVRQYLEGDFLRSIDGVFERSERFLQMNSNGIPPRFTDLQLEATRTATPADLQQLAQQYLSPDQLFEIVVGQDA